MALFTKPLTAGRNLILLLALFSLTFESCKKNETTLPVVAVEPSQEDDVEIYGEYVGRVRAQQFVEVRARVEGYLERMLFEEGTYVDKNQVLFIINQDQYKAKVDKARAQLKRTSHKNRKPSATSTESGLSMSRMRQVNSTSITQ